MHLADVRYKICLEYSIDGLIYQFTVVTIRIKSIESDALGARVAARHHVYV